MTAPAQCSQFAIKLITNSFDWKGNPLLISSVEHQGGAVVVLDHQSKEEAGETAVTWPQSQTESCCAVLGQKSLAGIFVGREGLQERNAVW